MFGLRPIELGGLRETWRAEYPLVQEQPPLPPQVEAPIAGPPQVQFVVGPALQTRVWFLNEEQTELVQLQPDRLTVTGGRPLPARLTRAIPMSVKSSNVGFSISRSSSLATT